jgi:hypothetical protein
MHWWIHVSVLSSSVQCRAVLTHLVQPQEMSGLKNANQMVHKQGRRICVYTA